MSDKRYSPKLRVAIAEVEAVLRKHDVGGMISLYSEQHCEFKFVIDPSWSLARFIRQGEAFHMKIYHSQQPKLDYTVGMLHSMRDIAALFFSQADQMCKQIAMHGIVERRPFAVSDINNDDREET